MDAWASPWADDALQHDENQGYEGTVSEPPNAGASSHSEVVTATPSAPQNIFGTKLHDPSFGGSSVWEAGSSLFGVDSSSAWASDSTPQPGGGPPDWNNNRAQSANVGFTYSPLIHQSPGFPGELGVQPDLGSSATGVSHRISEDWSQQLQPDWGALVATDLPTAETSPTVNQVESDFHAVQVPPVVNTKEKPPLDEFEGPPRNSVSPITEHPPPKDKELQQNVVTDSLPITEHSLPKAKEPKPNVDTDSSKNGLIEDQPEQQQDDDFDDFGDFGDYTEEGEIEETGFVSEPANPINPHVTPLSPLDFTITGSLVSKLYPVMQETLPIPPVEDIISTTAARKAWYRISRDGTVAEHNSGGGDDYIRVAWPKSKVRADVCEIVNRWIREGRFSVNGTMGGERSYGPMFGWGDGASPTQQNSGYKGSRSSLPPGVGLRGREIQQGYHKSSLSVPSWNLQVSDEPKDTSTVVNFGWGSSKVSKEESVSTIEKTNSTYANLEQKITSDQFSNLPNDTLPAASSTGLATSGSVKIDPAVLPSSTPQACQPPGATNTERRSYGDWNDLGCLPLAVAPLPEARHPIEVNRCEPPTVPVNNDGLDALAFLEKKKTTETPNKPHAHLLIESDISSMGLTLGENSGDKIFGTSEMEPTTDNDEWGEMIDSPMDFGTPEHNTSTIQSPQSHTPIIASSLVESIKSHSSLQRRDSAPSLLPSINDQSNSSGISASETGRSYVANTVDWDLSVFEGPTASSPSLRASSGCGIKEARKGLSEEDQQVLDILDKLPEMGYMLR